MPLGFRFHPTDQELISFFLYNRVLHRDYCENLIYEFDLFGKTPLWVVWENFGGPGLDDQDLYFFCQLKTRSQTRIKREIDSGGTWSESNPKPVKDLQNEKAIGKKRNLRYEKEVSEHDGDWLLEEYSIPRVVAGADDSDHEIGKVVLRRLKKNSRSRNKKNYLNSTQQVNEQPAKKGARKEVKEKPAKKKARKKVKQKPAKKKARNEVGWQNTTSVNTHNIEELQKCPSTSSAPVVPFDESNYKMISDAINHDQQCISNIDGSTMPTNFSEHDYVPIMSYVPSYPMSLASEGGESLLKDEGFLFDNGEEMFFDLDDLLAPGDCQSAWSQEELPQIEETQVPLPFDGMNFWNDCLWMDNCVQ